MSETTVTAGRAVCPGCQLNNMADECWHDAATWALAEAMRDGIAAMHPGKPWGSPVEMAWAFIDDAEALSANVGLPPYSVEAFHPDNMDAYTTIGLINGRYLFAVPNDEGDVSAELIGDCGARLTMAVAS